MANYDLSHVTKIAQAALDARLAADEAQRKAEGLYPLLSRLADGEGFRVGTDDVLEVRKGGQTIAKRWTNLFTNPSFETAGADQTLFTNLCTNPSFETAGSTVVGWTNLATNPSFETAGGGTVEVRRNFFPDPNATNQNYWHRWSYGGVNVNSVQSTDVAWTPGTSAVRVELTGSTNSLVVGMGNSTVKPLITSNGTYTFSLYARASDGSEPMVEVSDLGVGNSYTSSVTQISTGVYRITAFVTVNDYNAILANFRVNASWSGSYVSGFWIEGSAALIEKVYGALSWFSGAYSPDSDLTASWTSGANGSASILTGVQAATYGGGGGRFNIQSTQWSASGSKSVRIIPTGSTSFFGVAMSSLASLGLVNGDAVTVSATLRLAAPITTTVDATRGLRIWLSNASAVLKASSPAANNVAGVQRLSFTFTVDDTSDILRLGGAGTLGTGDIWWDDLCITKGTWQMGYHDGDAPPKVRKNYFKNPNMEGGSYGNTWANGARWTGEYSSELVHSGTRAVKATRTSDTSGGGYIATAPLPMTLTPGVTYTISAYIAGGPAGGGAGTFKLGGASQLSDGSAKTIAWPGTNVWTRVSTTFVYRSDLTSYLLFTDDSNTTTALTGVVYYIDDLLVEEGATLGDYFDGSASPDSRYLPAWEGAANASPSYLYDRDFTAAWYGVAHASTSSLSFTGASSADGTRPQIHSSVWSSNGSYSARALPTQGAQYPTDSFFNLPFSISSPANKTFTVAGKMYIPQDIQHSQMTVRFYWQDAQAAITTTNVNIVGENVVAGTYDFAATATAPSTTTGIPFLRVYTNINPNATNNKGKVLSVFLDDVTITEGSYIPGYFDGDTSPDSDMTAAWTSTAHASTSTLKAPQAQGVLGDSSRFRFQSPKWSKSGSKSLRVYASVGSSTQYDLIDLDTYGLGPGDSYTIKFTARTTHALASGTVFYVRYNGSATAQSATVNVGGLNGETQVTMTGTIPLDTTSSSRLRFQAYETAPDLWIDDIVIVEGEYDGEYFDGDSQPIEATNVFTNPAFKSASGVLTCRTNLYTKPRMHSTSNLGTYIQSGSATLTAIATGGPTGGPATFVRETVTTPGVASSTRIDSYIDTPVTPSKSVTYSIWSRASFAGRMMLEILFIGTDSSTYISSANGYYGGGTGTTVSANTWVRTAVTAMVPSNAGYVNFRMTCIGSTIPGAGETVDVTGVLIEQTSADLGYFDGSASPDADMVAAWTGPVDASTSTLTAVPINNVSTGSPSQNRTYQTTLYDGRKGVKALLTAPDAQSIRMAFPKPQVEPGETWTISFTAWTNRNQTAGQTSFELDTNYSKKVYFDPTTTPTRFTGTVTMGYSGLSNVQMAANQAIPGDWIIITDFVMAKIPADLGYFDGVRQPGYRRNLAGYSNGTATNTGATPSGSNTILNYGLVGRWFGSGGTGAFTFLTGSGIEGAPDTFIRKTWTVLGHTSDISTSFCYSSNNRRIPLYPGVPHTISFWFRKSFADDNYLNRFRVSFRDANDAETTYYTSAALAAAPVGEWVRYSYTFTPPAGSVQGYAFHEYYAFSSGHGGMVPGDYIDVTGLLVEYTTTLGDYFDGDSLYGAWEGAPGASPSILNTGVYKSAWDGTEDASTSRLWNGRYTQPEWDGAAHASTSSMWAEGADRS